MALSVAFEKNVGLFYFSGGLLYLRSPVVYKNHVCKYYIPSTKNQARISIPVHNENVLGQSVIRVKVRFSLGGS